MADQRDELTIHVHPARGDDGSSGAPDAPLRTLAEASRRANQATNAGPVTIVLAEGIYTIDETVVFRPQQRALNRQDRLTIRAEVMPDDVGWDTGRMPTLIHTMQLPDDWGERAEGWLDGMLVETSHVSILGLKILGVPLVESPQPETLRRLYGISRLDKDLDDLEIGHCLFAGEVVTNPHHVGIIAMGTGVDVHHCVFRGLKIMVVYWTPGSTGHAMRNCLCDGIYGSAVWTSEIANDFVYRNNVVLNSKYVWTYQSAALAAADPDAGGSDAPAPATAEPTNLYTVSNSLFAGNAKLTGSGTGANLGYEDLDPSFLVLDGTTVTDQPIATEPDQAKRTWLHPNPGTSAATIGAGLFTNI